MRQVHLIPTSPYRCVEHGTVGSLPCAWPSCPNGLAEPQFEEVPLFTGQEVAVFSRQRWESPLGGHYFSWDSSQMPNWFFIRQIYWNEARRFKLVGASSPDTVYHYTSLAGFVGIVETKSIWLSDFSYLNDSRELTHGMHLANEVIDSIVANMPNAGMQTLLLGLKKKLENLTNRVCVASFSIDGDSLAQWRAYGPIAIGFSTYPLALHVNQASLHAVEYNRDAQRKLIEIYVHHLGQAFLRDAETGHLDKGLRESYQQAEQLLEILAFFKDSAFRSENEIRLAYVDNPTVFESLGFDPLPKSFRQTPKRLIPYVASSDVLRSKVRNFEIEVTEVILGPECDDLLERGVREFLSAKSLEKVALRRSTVPLRS